MTANCKSHARKAGVAFVLPPRRSMGFGNEAFYSLAAAVDRLREAICRLTDEMVKRIAERKWIVECYEI